MTIDTLRNWIHLGTGVRMFHVKRRTPHGDIRPQDGRAVQSSALGSDSQRFRSQCFT
jgi:hypothetical protein